MPVPQFYFRAQDHHGDSPEILRKISSPTSNLVVWQRNASIDLSTEFMAYLQNLRHADPEASGTSVPQEVYFNNGEKLIILVDRALIFSGFEHLKTEIQNIGNQVIQNVGLPVTFYSESYEGQGLSSLKFLSRSQIVARILVPQEDDYFHLDGVHKTPTFAPNTPDAPSVPVTVITEFMGASTRGVKAEFLAPASEEFIHQMRAGADRSSWNKAIQEVAQRSGKDVLQNIGRYNVGVFGCMPLGVRGRTFFDGEPTYAVNPHAAPVLTETSDPRLTLVLRAHIGGGLHPKQ